MRIEIVRGDITLEVVDAIVNAANAELLPDGGVSGAIHAAGGPEIATAAAPIAVTTAREAQTAVEVVRFVLFDKGTYAAFAAASLA